MNILFRVGLELIRILAGLGITIGIVNSLVEAILNTVDPDMYSKVREITSFIGLVIFVIWYKRRGQYTGWYKSRKP